MKQFVFWFLFLTTISVLNPTGLVQADLVFKIVCMGETHEWKYEDETAFCLVGEVSFLPYSPNKKMAPMLLYPSLPHKAFMRSCNLQGYSLADCQKGKASFEGHRLISSSGLSFNERYEVGYLTFLDQSKF